MIIELAGPVGAGKSAVAAGLPEALRARGIPASTLNEVARLNRPRTWLWSTWFAIRHPRLTWAAWRAASRAPIPWWHRRLIFGLTVGVGGRIAYARRRVPRGHVVLVDEGLVHRAVNLYSWYPGVPEDAVRRYVSLVPLPDALIHVDADPDTARSRVQSRGLPRRLVGRSQTDVAAFVARARAVVTGAVAAFQQRPGATVIKVTNRQSLRRSITNAARSTSRLVSEASPSAGSLVLTPRYPIVGRPDRAVGRLRIRRSGGIPAAQLAEVLERYGLRAAGRPRTLSAPRARGATMLVRTSEGEVVVKRYKPNVEPSALAIEHAVLAALAVDDFPAPRLRTATDATSGVSVDGACFAVSDAIRGYRHPHEMVMAPGDRRQLDAIAARLLARLHAVLEDLDIPPSATLGFAGRNGPRVRDVSWYADRLADAPAPRRVRAWVHGALWELYESFEAEGLATTVVHGDYGPYNLLVRPGQVPMVVDFELARRDWRLVDLATGIGWFAQRRRRFDVAAGRRFLDAYRQGSTITEDELQRLPQLAAFLALQRAVIAWSRTADGTLLDWDTEARWRVVAAEDLLAGRHPLNAVVRRW
jgi:Ser/Thr protein kinase RdoA (MazF antagonist)/thymidylate kinase